MAWVCVAELKSMDMYWHVALHKGLSNWQAS